MKIEARQGEKMPVIGITCYACRTFRTTDALDEIPPTFAPVIRRLVAGLVGQSIHLPGTYLCEDCPVPQFRKAGAVNGGPPDAD